MNNVLYDNRLFFNSLQSFDEWNTLVESRASEENISILFLNIRSVGKHWDSLLSQILLSKSTFQIILLAELGCEEVGLKALTLDLPHFNKVFKLREHKQGGGLLMLYNSRVFNFTNIHLDFISAYEHITGTFEVTGLNQRFTIHLMYRPPTSSSGIPIPQSINEIDKVMNVLESEDILFMVGDTNIDVNKINDANVQRHEAVLSSWAWKRNLGKYKRRSKTRSPDYNMYRSSLLQNQKFYFQHFY